MPEALRFTLLGAPKLSWRDQPVPSPQTKLLALLAYLAARAEPVDREELAEVLWGPGKARNLRQALYLLRNLPGAAEWLQAGDQVTLHAETDLAQIGQALRAGQPAEALRAWETPDGRPKTLLALPDLPDTPAFSDWLDTERARLHDLYLGTLRDHALALERAGQAEAALPVARRLAEQHPYDDAAQQLLIRLEHRAGSLEQALAAFERHRTLLREELDAEPSPETLALVRQLEGEGGGRGKQPRLVSDPAELPPLPPQLFGRHDDLSAIEARMATGRRLVLQGMGGIGKTALAAALAAERLRGGARVLWLELGHDPPEVLLAGLAEALDVQVAAAREDGRARTELLGQALRAAGLGLVVLDDAWNSYALARLLDVLPPELPTLITSRARHPGVPHQRVGRLDRAAALDLLGHHAPHLSPHDPRADALCALLGDHAYAVRLAGITLRRQDQGPAALLSQLQAAPHQLGDQEGSVETLLALSLDTVDDEAYEAFLGMGGLFVASSTPELLALALRRDPEATEAALYRLVESGLARREARPGQDVAVFRLHDLAWSYARIRQTLRPASAVRAARLYAEANTARPAALDADLSNILAAAERARLSERYTELVGVMRGLVGGNFITARGNPPGMLDLLCAAAGIAEDMRDWEAAQALHGKIGDIQQAYLVNHSLAAQSYHHAKQLAASAGLVDREVVYSTILAWHLTLEQAPKNQVDDLLVSADQLAQKNQDLLLVSRVLETNAFVSARRGEFEKSRDYLQHAYELLHEYTSTKPHATESFKEALQFVTFNLGQAMYRLKDLNNALKFKLEALSLAKDRDERRIVAKAHMDVGELLFELKLGDKALDHFRSSEIIFVELGLHSELAHLRGLISRASTLEYLLTPS